MVVGKIRSDEGPGPSTPTPKATSTASATLTETPTAMMTETPTATIEKTDTEPAEISIQDANVLDDDIFMMEIWLNRMCMRMFMILMCGKLWVVLGLILRFKVRHIFTRQIQSIYRKLFVRKEDPSSNSFIMKVYLDGVQKYKSKTITKEMGAYEFDCDITGANKVKVEFSMVDGDGVGRAFLADGKFVKD